jgi:hypothetical protein
MLLQLLLYYGFLQSIRNLLRFLQIDSEVFWSRTPASRSMVPSVIVDCLPYSPTHSNMIFQFLLWSRTPPNHDLVTDTCLIQDKKPRVSGSDVEEERASNCVS